jgi:hypothetical protein
LAGKGEWGRRRYRAAVLLAAAYAAIQLGRGTWYAFLFVDPSCDLRAIHEMWESFLAGRPAGPYLAHAHLLLTPLFALGRAPGRAAMFVVNVGLVWYIWRQLAIRAGLDPALRWVGMILFCDWTATRAVIGQGQVGLLVLAAAVTRMPPGPVWLTVLSIKQSLAFPFFVDAAAARRWRELAGPALFALGVAAVALYATGIGPGAYVASLGEGMSHQGVGGGQTDLASRLEGVMGSRMLASGLLAAPWLLAYRWVRKRVQAPLAVTAALLVLSLLPVYHRFYDLVVLAPALALLLRHRPPVYALGLTAMLAGGFEHLTTRGYYGIGWLGAVLEYYYPALLLGLLAVLAGLERRVVGSQAE